MADTSGEPISRPVRDCKRNLVSCEQPGTRRDDDLLLLYIVLPDPFRADPEERARFEETRKKEKGKAEKE